MAGQARVLRMTTGCESQVIITARACLVPVRPYWRRLLALRFQEGQFPLIENAQRLLKGLPRIRILSLLSATARMRHCCPLSRVIDLVAVIVIPTSKAVNAWLA